MVEKNYAEEAAKQAKLRASAGAKKLARQADEDRTKQRERETLGIAELKKAIALFDKNYGKGMEAHARADASSAAITSGLGGTTRPGAVSAGLSAEFEDMRRGRLAQAQTNLGQFLGSYRDPYGVTPQVELGQQQLTQQGWQAGQQLNFDYAQLDQQNKQFNAQLGQQNTQFGAELGLGYASLNARNNQPASGDSIWGPRQLPTAMTGGGGGGYGGGSGGGSGGGGYGGSNYEPIQSKPFTLQEMAEAWLDPSAQGF